MNNYDCIYYVAMEPSGEDHVFPMPKAVTAARKYSYVMPVPGSPPYFFLNGFKKRDMKKGINRVPGDVVLNGSDLIVCDDLYQQISKYSIKDLCFHPAVYIDDEDVWYENYWFLTFTGELRCLDLKASTLDPESDQSGAFNYEVDKYSLKESVLDKIEEEKRLMFKMDEASMGYVFAHKKIVDIFEAFGASGVRFMRVDSFEEGDQYP